MKIKIAVVQFKINQFKPEENLKKAEKFIKKASSKADIIVFPEDFLTGPILRRKEYIDFNSKYRRHFQNLAKKYSIDIVAGSFIEGDKSKWYNTSYYIDSSGKIKGKYRKINLWYPEDKYDKISEGNKICVFKTKYGKFGLTICWDLVFPEVWREMFKKNIKVVFCPSYWTREDASRIGLRYNKNSEIEFVNSLCTARAFENNIILIYCNAAGKLDYYKKLNLIGRSQITEPFKGVIKRFDHDKEEMFIQKIDTRILKDSDKVYRIKKDFKRKYSRLFS